MHMVFCGWNCRPLTTSVGMGSAKGICVHHWPPGPSICPLVGNSRQICGPQQASVHIPGCKSTGKGEQWKSSKSREARIQ